jgi:carboxylesterase type B
LATGDGLTSNNGLHDQIMALTLVFPTDFLCIFNFRWVHENCQVFGGDPSNVLLMGQGSGAASASLLALSPRAEGLFHKIVLMSGTAITPGVVRDTAVNATWTLGSRFYWKTQRKTFNF